MGRGDLVVGHIGPGQKRQNKDQSSWLADPEVLSAGPTLITT